jgi:hypothetical protein
MQEIKTLSLSDEQIEKCIKNHPVRKKNRVVVENFLMSISTEYTKEENMQSAAYEADSCGLDTGEYNAMVEGVDLLFY